MAALKQDPHRMEVTTPLGPDKLLLTSFQGTEEFSRPFHFGLTMVSEDPAIQAKAIVGKNVTVKLKYPAGGERFFNGIVSRFAYQGTNDRHSVYRAEVVPALWLLTRTADCRIFQDKDIPAILKDVFGKFGISDYKFSPTKSYPTREYCVQYRETAFNFVSRLMEQYGIFYFFKHEDGKHTLVLGDDVSAYVDCKEKDVFMRQSVIANVDRITRWEHQFEYRPGKWTHTDYNFKTPKTDLKTDSTTIVDLPGNKSWEIFDYPGEYVEKPEGEALVRIRMEEDEMPHDVVNGGGQCRSFSPGGKFTMEEHISPSEKGKKYVITSVTHSASGPEYTTGSASGEDIYQNTFTCVPDSAVLRPARLTPKPVIHGSQTAVVVGPSGEEIYPDNYGRVKVQFFWDREGKKDDKSSCWIRCMVPSAGRNWGFVSIPRIGQEVVVSYLDGDPDRPLITGQVYNADQMPAYTLPDEKTKSYLKTNTSKGGEGHNELRFEDKKGDEQVYLHAEKDMDCRVKNDSKERIYGNRHEIIGYEKDGKKGGDQRELIYQDKHLKVKRHQIEQTEGNFKMMVGNGEAADGGNLDIVVEKKEAHSVGDGGMHLEVKGDVNEKIDGTVSQNVGMDVQQKIGMNYAVESGQTVYIKGGMTVVIEGGLQLSLKVGGSFVNISPIGVDIFGPLVNINSGGAAGSGTPPQPKDPKEAEKAVPTKPDEADKSKSGKKSCD
ncbi:MAG: type VI secretion system tip protein TssI/VgrG [Planctomycetota bacterium]